MRLFATPAELVPAVGERLGESRFRKIGQRQIDLFAALTGDHQWIHTDPERARAGPFGAPVAHGFLALSLITAMLGEIFQVAGADLVLNKGLDRLRFTSPVPAEVRIRAVADLASATARPHSFIEAVVRVALEVEGRRGPALTAHHRLLYRSAVAMAEHRPAAESGKTR